MFMGVINVDHYTPQTPIFGYHNNNFGITH